MAKRSWFMAIVLLALLFVTSDCLRGPTANVDVSPSTTIRARGGSRFSPKVEETPETSPQPFSSQSRSNRRGRPPVTSPSGRAADKKTEITTLRSRRDRDRNNEVSRSGKFIAETSKSSRGREISGSNVRRNSPPRGQVSDHEADLARAASSDRRYLPEGKDRRGRKLDPDVPLELPKEGPKVSRRQRGRTSGEVITSTTSTTSTTSAKPRPTGRSRTRDSGESKRSSPRRITERSTERRTAEKEESTPRTLGRRIIERSTRRSDPSAGSDQAPAGSTSTVKTTTFTSRKSSVETSEYAEYTRRFPPKYSVFTPGEFESFDPLKDIQTDVKSRKSPATTLSKLRSTGRSGESISRKTQNSIESDSSTKSQPGAKAEKYAASSEKISRFRARSEIPQARSTKIEINTLKPKISVKIDKLRSPKGEYQARSKAPGKIDKLRLSRQEITPETTTQFLDTTPGVTTLPPDLQDSTPFLAAESFQSSTQVSPIALSTSISSSSSSREGKETVNKRRQAPVTSTPSNRPSQPPPPKDDYFNHGLGFRGRKPHAASASGTPQGNPTSGNPGWTLKRRPHTYADANQTGGMAPPVAANEIPSAPRRQVSSVIFKIDREITSDDNYPPEFKAKLATLNRSDQDVPSSGSRITEDIMMTVIRHSRSVDQKAIDSAFPENDQFPETVSPFPVVTTPLGEPEEALDGSKKRPGSIPISAKSREKLAIARRLIKPEIISEEVIGSDEIRAISSRTSRTTTAKAPSGKRFGTSTTARPSPTVPTSKSYTRTSKSVQRSNVRVVETTSIRKLRPDRTTDDNELVQTTLPYTPEPPAEAVRSQTVKSWVLSPRGKTPPPERSPTTTRRSRSQSSGESTTRSSSLEAVTHIQKISRTTKRPRHWNAAYIDKNWQDPSERFSESTESPATRRSFTPSRLTKPSSSEISRSSELGSTTVRPLQPIKRRESRPRTATYRRHSEGPVTSVTAATVESIAITPKIPKFHSSVRSSNSSERPARQEPAVSVAESNGTLINDGNSTGIFLTNRGSSGTAPGGDSNIFNPARTTYLISSNATLLEQLRSTVAPLLTALGNRTPIFSAAYSTVDPGNSTRVTPSGSPARFSARYRGAELFVRKPSGLDSSGPTTPLTSSQSDIPLNSQMELLNGTTEMGLLTTEGPPSSATPSSVNPQGGRIIQDRERDKASRTKEAGGQRSSVYIGQEKFINYWSDDSANKNDSRVVSVKINSITSAVNEGPVSSTGPLPPLDIISQDQVTAPPGFPWKDPLDQIFGITTESQVIRASVASNTIDEQSPSRSPITVPPINRLAEVFTPMLNDATLARDTSITTTTVAPSVSTTFSTTSTTTLAATTSTATTRPTTTTTTTTTTAVPSTVPVTISSTTLNPTTPSFSTVAGRPTPFGATFDDLAFLNSLLQSNQNGNFISSSTPKTLNDVEKLLANRILSLALGNAGPTRSPKAIQPSNSAPNSLDPYPPTGSTSQPIIIDLLKSTSKKVVLSTTSAPVTWKPTVIVTASHTGPRYTATSTLPPVPTLPTSSPKIGNTVDLTSTQIPWMFPTHPPTMRTTSTTTTTTTTPPPTTTTTTIPRPTTTTQRASTARRPPPRPSPTQPPFRFGANLLQAIFGRNIFAPQSTQRPTIIRRPQVTVQITPRTTTSTTTTTPRPSTTFSPEDDAKFLLQLLNAANNEKKPSKAAGELSRDDESFLRSILNGQATVKTPSPGGSTPSDAALLAKLLEAQGIRPSTPANNIRDQLDFLSKGGSTTHSPKTTPRRITTSKPRVTDWAPSSTYPSPLFSNFNFGADRPRGQGGAEGAEGFRNQMLNAAIGATRVFSQFLGAAITGAAQQLQSIVRNGTRIVSEVVG